MKESNVVLYSQKVVNILDGNTAYEEVLVHEYRNVCGINNILFRVDRSMTHVKFDIDVLKETLEYIKHNPTKEYGIGVNICNKTLEKEYMADRIISMVEESGINKNKLVLEINEKTIFSSKIVLNNLEKLYKSGIILALDDFGVENANLTTLFLDYFKIIKLDKKLIDDICEIENRRTYIVLKHAIKMINELGIVMVAEGVETEEQLYRVKDLGCVYVQGFIYSKPEILTAF